MGIRIVCCAISDIPQEFDLFFEDTDDGERNASDREGSVDGAIGASIEMLGEWSCNHGDFGVAERCPLDQKNARRGQQDFAHPYIGQKRPESGCLSPCRLRS